MQNDSTEDFTEPEKTLVGAFRVAVSYKRTAACAILDVPIPGGYPREHLSEAIAALVEIAEKSRR